jgi:hypothetical protein
MTCCPRPTAHLLVGAGPPRCPRPGPGGASTRGHRAAAQWAGKTTTLLRARWRAAGRPERSPLRGSWGPKAPVRHRAECRPTLVTEERSVFMKLTVAEGLRVGRCDQERALALFPEFEPLLPMPADLVSGGEQRMLGETWTAIRESSGPVGCRWVGPRSSCDGCSPRSATWPTIAVGSVWSSSSQ